MTVPREREYRCIQIATLDPEHYRNNEMNRRVYSTEGLCPTIPTKGGGGTVKKILVTR